MRKLFTSLLLSFVGLAACEPAYAFKIGGLNWVTGDGTANQAIITNGSGSLSWKTFISGTSLSATAPLTYNSGTGVFAMPAATTSANGYLTSADWTTFNTRITGLTSDVTATGPSSGPAVVNATVVSVGGQTASNVAAGAVLANAATNANTVSAIVKRDSSGNFSAGTVTASLTGNVTGNLTGSVTGTASGNLTLTTPHNHGVLLSGSANATSAITPSSSTAFPLVSGGSSADPSWASLTVPGGGTGVSSFTSNGMVYGQGSSALAVTAAGSQYQTFQAGSSGVPTIDALHLDQAAAVTGTLPNANTTATSASTASAIVARDSSKNFLANNSGLNVASTVSAGSSSTLTVASARLQVLTGSSTHTFVLPDATTLGQAGFEFDFVNNSTGLLTINDGGSTLVGTVPAGGAASLHATAIGSAAGTWAMRYGMPANASYGTSGLSVTGTLASSGDFAVATNKFTVAAATGNTLAAGTLSSTGDFAVATNKFTVASSSGNTAVAGTLGVTGVATLTAQPILSSLTASLPVFTNSSKGLVSNTMTGTGSVVMSDSPNLTGTVGIGTTSPSTTLHVSGSGIWSDQAAGQGEFIARRFDGSIGSPTAVQSGEQLSNFGTRAYGTTGFSGSSRTAMRGWADQTWTDTHQGAYTTFDTTPDNTALSVERMRITAGGTVGIGLTSPTSYPDSSTILAVGGDSANENVAIVSYGNGGSSSPALRGFGARGSLASPTAVQSGDNLVLVGGHGYGASGFTSGSKVRIEMNATQTWTDSANGSQMLFITTPNGSTTAGTALTIGQDKSAAFAGAVTAATTLGVTGVATFTAQPIVSSLTASLPVFTDSSKGLVSNSMVGTGSVVMSASPSVTGNWVFGTSGARGTIKIVGDTIPAGPKLEWDDTAVSGGKDWIMGENLSVGAGTFEIRNGTDTTTVLTATSSLLASTIPVTFSNAAVKMTGITTGTNADTVCLKSDGTLLIQAAACTISSRRFKENIRDFDDDALGEVMALRPVIFNMKQGDKPNADTANFARTQIGLIAEEVEAIDPKLAIYEPDGKTPKSYRQEALISLLVKAVQEQQREIQTLKKAIHH